MHEDGEAEREAGRVLPLDGVLDLHTFQARQIGDLVPTWLDECRAHGLSELRIVHGKGQGTQRRIVHAILARRSDVESYRLAPGHRGGWGATLVTLRQSCPPVGAEQDQPTLEFGATAGDFTLAVRQLLAAPLDEVFSLLSDPHQLQSLMPPFVRFEIASPEPVVMRHCARIDYRIKLRSVPFRWRSEISCWEPPTRFVDEQLRGPYLRWRHEHRFEPRGDHTLVCDDVVYRVPGGRAVHALFVRPELGRIFACRGAKLVARFGRADDAGREGVRKPTR